VTLVDLLERYRPGDSDEAADVKRVLDLARGDDDPWSRESALHVTASALIVHPPSAQVLLRWHVRQNAWLQVGGHGDPGESDPVEIALREGREETSLPDLTPWPGPDLLHAVVVPVPARGNDPAHEHADLRFVLATAVPEQARPERPDAPLRWLTLPAAMAATDEANVRESLARLDALFRA
jgi:8-oxo-dGTP pyrophosphatase MutT (NUDIX family)